MNECLQALVKEKKDIYVMGDMNINFLNSSSVKCINDYVNIIYNNAMQPLIDKPTRITNSTVSLIDNILTNVHSKHILSGLFYTDLTDHLPVFQITVDSDYESPIEFNRDLCSCNINSVTIEFFKDDISIIDWNNVLLCNDSEGSYNVFFR